MEIGPHVGRRVPRIEDRGLLAGATAFVDDLQRPGEPHRRVVRSDVAHGRNGEPVDALLAEAAALGARGAELTALPLTPQRLHPLITPGDP